MSAFSKLVGGVANLVSPILQIAPVDTGTKFIASAVTSELGKKDRERKLQKKRKGKL